VPLMNSRANSPTEAIVRPRFTNFPTEPADPSNMTKMSVAGAPLASFDQYADHFKRRANL
jgi:hypothetical protein